MCCNNSGYIDALSMNSLGITGVGTFMANVNSNLSADMDSPQKKGVEFEP